MKTTDDYRAKYRLWAENPRVAPAPPAATDSAFQEQTILVARRDECLEAFTPAAVGAVGAGEMNELLQEFNAAGVRYLLIGGQAMRLAGLPRYSKQAANHPHDQADLEFLLELQRLGKLL